MQETSPQNRRKEPRVPSDGNVYVVLDTQPRMIGQMVEISSKGLAFTFVDLEALSQKLESRTALRLDLFKGGRGYFIRDLDCRLVSQINNQAPNAFSSMLIKRVGVEFESPTLPQQIQINGLVKQQHRNTRSNDQAQCLP